MKKSLEKTPFEEKNIFFPWHNKILQAKIILQN